MMLLNFFIVIAATFVSVDADDPYIPCKSFISFSYDDSNFVRNDEFKTQMNFIKNAIGALNHPERLRAEGAYTAEFNWNSGLSIAQEQSSFDFSQQTLMAYSLLQQFASLVTSVETLDATDDPIAALIFISDTSDRALANAARFLPQLSCIQITFILFGPNADQNKLTNFSSNFISWRNLSQAQPDNWDSVLYNAYGCSGSSSTVTIPPFTTTSLPSITTTTTMSTGTGSTTPMPYMPCQSWISFSYDDSNTLPNNNFKTQMSFISTFIGSINYPNRLRIQGAYTDVASWYSGQSIAQMQTEINNTQQTDNKYSLLMEFATLVNYLPTNDWPVGALIFISDTSDQALRNAYRFMPQLSSVQLTFVLLGSNVDSSKLTNFSSNFIYWSDLSKPKPDNWDTVALTALGCTNPSSVSLPQLTTTTTTISRGTGSTTPMPYMPCQSWISFSYDDSNTLPNNNFKTHMCFISTFIGSINYPNRLRIQGAYTDVASWYSGQSIAQMQTEINNTQQTDNKYSLLMEFATLVNYLPTNDWPVGALIFISDTSEQALRNAYRFMPQLSSVQLTFVLLGPNVDSSKLTNFSSNFISWRNLSQAQPDNWDSVLYNAYGCSGSSSTVTIPPFTTTTTTSLPSTTTTISTGTGSTTPMPYMPCQSWISFSYDDSNTLPNNNFKTQMSFISTFIGSINYPNRLRIQGAYTDVASWYSGQSIAQMQTEINNTQQTDNKYSLLMEFATLVNYLPTNDWPVGALIFISDTSDQALRNAYRFMPQLSSVQLTFVLLGSNVDSSKLTNFSSNFIYWSDLSKPKPDNWDTVALTALGCTNPSSVSLPQLTTTTTTISRGTGSTTPMPYMPCQSWISFSYDDSNTLPNNNFKTHMCFISTFIGSINYPNRFRIQGAYTDVASWYSGQSIVQMQTEINNTQQTVISYSLLQQFAGIVNNLNSTLGTNWPIGAMVFISDTSDHALRNAMRFMPIFKNFHLQLTFVLLGPNVDSSKLTNFSSNFIYWSDLSKPKPDNWDTVALTALGCTNPSSVSLPPSTTMSTVTDMPYLPCQSWISFSYDDSYALENANYRAQMSFISSAITNINYPDRLRVNGVFTNVASFNSHQTISQMQAEIISVQQTAISYSLLQEFGNLLTDVKTIENNQNWTIGALIFISDTSDSALANANIFFSQLPPSVKITFVLLGPTTESTKLTQFSTNFIYWKDFSQPQPDSWDTLSYAAFGCQQ